MEEDKKEVEEELTEEEIAKMDALLGFGGGCDCNHCDQGCHDEAEEETEVKE